MTPVDVYRRQPLPKEEEPKKTSGCCWKKKKTIPNTDDRVNVEEKKKHEREMTQHEINYSNLLRTERVAKKALESKK